MKIIRKSGDNFEKKLKGEHDHSFISAFTPLWSEGTRKKSKICVVVKSIKIFTKMIINLRLEINKKIIAK